MARFSRHLGRIPANAATFRGSQAPFRVSFAPLTFPAPSRPGAHGMVDTTPKPHEPTCLRPVSPLEAVHHNGAESTAPRLERWQSGRMHRTRNAAYGQPYRGFKSLPLRQPRRFAADLPPWLDILRDCHAKVDVCRAPCSGSKTRRTPDGRFVAVPHGRLDRRTALCQFSCILQLFMFSSYAHVAIHH